MKRLTSTPEQIDAVIPELGIRWADVQERCDADGIDLPLDTGWERRVPPHAVIYALLKEVEAYRAALERERASQRADRGELLRLRAACRQIVDAVPAVQELAFGEAS